MFAAKNELLTRPSGYQISRSLRFRASASAYLVRTFNTPTNNKIWTWSGWIKRGLVDATYRRFFTASANGDESIRFTNSNALEIYFNGYTSGSVATTQVFRDTSAWFHIIVAIDTTQATASNRVKFYVNGNLVTALATANYPAQNYNTSINSAGLNYFSSGLLATEPFDGYLAEVNFIDGQALTPSSFGAFDTNGVWQPARYTGSYGTNGFYLNFSDNSGATSTTIGKDSSGNSNNWTPNNISVTSGATYDSMIDSPTNYADGGNGRGNYAVLNPLPYYGGAATITNGNTRYTNTATNWGRVIATIPVSSGKWYWEVTMNNSPEQIHGVQTTTTTTYYSGGTNWIGYDAGGYGYYSSNGNKYNNNVSVAYGSSYTTGDIIGIALDLDNGAIYFGKQTGGTGSMVWQNSGVPTSGSSMTGAAYTGLSGTYVPAFALTTLNGANTFDVNFGQRPFSATPPSGFSALNTQNLPTPTIAAGNKYFDATTYTGNGTTQSITNSGSFQPDLVWIKVRNNTYSHQLYDVNRGANLVLVSDSTQAETNFGTMPAFNSNGFNVSTNSGAYLGTNGSGSTFVGWQWKAGGTGVSNTSGSITSTVSANTSAGFSVVNYTGTGTTGTVGHGLGVAPSMIILKVRNQVDNWIVYHAGLGTPATNALLLNTTGAVQTGSLNWNSTNPTSSVFSVYNPGSGGYTNGNGYTYVAYCFAPVAGYSAFGSYTGNGSADGTFVYTGFRPRWVMIKVTNTVNAWIVIDSARDAYNSPGNYLLPNSSGAEGSVSPAIDLLSNGFKFRLVNGGWNASGENYIYAAFAENPLKFARAR